MKNLLILLYFLSSSAEGAPHDRSRGLLSSGSWDVDELKDSNMVSWRVQDFDQRASSMRDLKGGASKSLSSSPCEKMQVSVTTADLEDNAIDSTNGYSTKVKVYKKGTKQQVATWFEEVAYTNKAESDGIGVGLIAFNVNAAISFAGVLSQKQLPITGGSGKFACATGFIEAVSSTKSKTHYEINVCYVC